MNWNQLLSSRRQGEKNFQAESSRSSFEQDYDRIIFSHPFRRLQDKTQVHPLPEDDFVHTRLTHSLEVSSVGRSLGRKAGEVIVQRHPVLKEQFSMFDFGAITAAAALAHDLGNPPFGHAGEDALADFFSQSSYGQTFQEKVSPGEWKDLVKFEGNAQGFRLISQGKFGLRLTLATLGAFTKYPCASDITPRDKKRKSQKKFGFFQSEKETFIDLAQQLGLQNGGELCWRRHPLAFLVEAADDICYNIIDLEDACRLGLVSFTDTVDLLALILREEFDRTKMSRHDSQNEMIAVLRAMAIRKLVDECTTVFLEHEASVLEGTFDHALTDHCESKTALDQITSLSVEKIYRAKQVVEIEASGHEVLPGLLEEFLKAGEMLFLQKNDNYPVLTRKYQNLTYLMPIETKNAIANSSTTYEVARHCLDYISGLTDKYALSLYRKIKGVGVAR